ncbi:hypothetical protein KJ365_00820 [Glaciecola sp. XM2]|uniref:hypothetical protein n=1 Tax=Glaciecola sp. XM2 TaxID=1914931 RepID=UPI001BDF2B9C|nr:hypothetical protein [Glaciecola sp. XM2]MBT1449409.1 hypothetical protein [Glaciecola sp. XM2]
MLTKLQQKRLINALAVVSSIFILSGCGATLANMPAPVENISPQITRIDNACLSQVTERENAIRDSHSPAQFIALANQSMRCLQGVRFYPNHPDNQQGMQLHALAVVNYVKGGDVETAQKQLDAFKVRFVQQDLVFDDYTSFIDTATALLDPNLSARQLAMLNINPNLKSELSRVRQWSL